MKEKRNMAAVLGTLLLSIMFVFSYVSDVSAHTAADRIRVVDQAGLLSDGEEAQLSDQLDEISERQQVDVVVVTADSLEGASAMEYADDFFDYNGYGLGDERDGILFLISMEDRSWYISTSGYGIVAVTDAGLEYMSEKFLPYLKDGEYAKAFGEYALQCDDYITQAQAGTPYDVDHIPTEPFSHAGALLIAIAVGVVAALIATGIMRLGLHSVYSKIEADSYVKKNSLRLTREHELFLYKTVTQREKPKEERSSNSSSSSSGGSSTHTSSSGKTHGGGGGSF